MIEVTFDGFDLCNPVSGYDYGVTQVDFPKAPWRSENVKLPMKNGTKYIKKLKDERKITVSMVAITEKDVGYLKAKLESYADDLKAFHYKIGDYEYNQQAELQDFKFTEMPFDFKIQIDFTVPQEV